MTRPDKFEPRRKALSANFLLVLLLVSNLSAALSLYRRSPPPSTYDSNPEISGSALTLHKSFPDAPALGGAGLWSDTGEPITSAQNAPTVELDDAALEYKPIVPALSDMGMSDYFLLMGASGAETAPQAVSIESNMATGSQKFETAFPDLSEQALSTEPPPLAGAPPRLADAPVLLVEVAQENSAMDAGPSGEVLFAAEQSLAVTIEPMDVDVSGVLVVAENVTQSGPPGVGGTADEPERSAPTTPGATGGAGTAQVDVASDGGAHPRS